LADATASTVRIATRGSLLALWQANHVADLIRDEEPGLTVELVTVSTEGDRRTDVPLAVIGGKGVFVKEVQAAVLDGRADLAVHSAKDLPAITPDGLTIAAFPRRADARDVLVGAPLSALGPGSVVATGSPRRRAQMADLVPGLRFEDLRGNIDTRLEKAAGFDAIIMAAAALDRLDRHPDSVDLLDPVDFVPQVGQGALAIECRADDVDMRSLLSAVDDDSTRRAVECERAFLGRLGGDCDLPAGAHATLDDDLRITVRAVLGAGPVRRVTLDGWHPVAVGTEAAERLLDESGA
jgi:hydroxymethylbilane synthase